MHAEHTLECRAAVGGHGDHSVDSGADRSGEGEGGGYTSTKNGQVLTVFPMLLSVDSVDTSEQCKQQQSPRPGSPQRHRFGTRLESVVDKFDNSTRRSSRESAGGFSSEDNGSGDWCSRSRTSTDHSNSNGRRSKGGSSFSSKPTTADYEGSRSSGQVMTQ